MGIGRKNYDNLSDALDAYKGLHQSEKQQNIAKWNQSKITVNPKLGKFEVGKLTFLEQIQAKLGSGPANRKVLLRLASEDSSKTLNKAYEVLFGMKVETKFLFDHPNNPLIQAASSGDFTKVLSFLEEPADGNPYDTIKLRVDPQILKVALEAAAANGHADIVGRLIVHDRNNISQMCLTALNVGAEYNRKDVVEKAVRLLKSPSWGNIDRIMMHPDISSAFAAAAKNGHAEIAHFLIKKEMLNLPTSFIIAAKYGCLSVIELITQDREILERSGQEALRGAIDNRQLETVNMLLDKGVAVEDALITLAANGTLDSFKYLLEIRGVKPETLQTARVIAEESLNHGIADYLIHKGVTNPLDQGTVFIYAAKHDHDKAVERLMEKVELTPDTIKTALWALMDGDKRSLLYSLMKKNQSVEIARNAIIEAAKNDRWFLFSDLSMGARHLLDDKAKEDVFGQALIAAAKNGNKDSVQHLISLANLDMADSEGKTAYQYAYEIADIHMKHSLNFYYKKKT